MSRRRTGAIAAALSVLVLGSPLITAYGAQTTIVEVVSNQAAESYSAEFYINRAIERGKSRDYSGAISDIHKAKKIQSNRAILYGLRGSIKGMSGDSKGGCTDWKKGIH